MFLITKSFTPKEYEHGKCPVMHLQESIWPAKQNCSKQKIDQGTGEKSSIVYTTLWCLQPKLMYLLCEALNCSPPPLFFRKNKDIQATLQMFPSPHLQIHYMEDITFVQLDPLMLLSVMRQANKVEEERKESMEINYLVRMKMQNMKKSI